MKDFWSLVASTVESVINSQSLEPIRVLTFPGFGFETAQGEWKLRLTGVAFQLPVEYNLRKRIMLRMLRNAMHVTAAETECDLFRTRVRPFLSDAEHRLKIFAEIGGKRFRLKRRTRRDGHFQAWLNVPASVVNLEGVRDEHGKHVLPVRFSTNDATIAPSQGMVYLLGRTGTSVISDIDDTIKESLVTNRRQLLANTFLRDFRGVDGMANVYRNWAAQGVDFHYVSSSPWQLFDSLLNMRINEGFPSGTLHLRRFRLRDQLLKKVLILRRKGKVAAIKSIIKQLPDRNFILIGDSGEKDPEIYRKIARKYPDQVRGLFIRDLVEKPINSERLRRLRISTPSGLCKTFRNSEELEVLVSETLLQVQQTSLAG